ncbi:MAG: DUF3560 domain-containing protein [Alistipes sp.]|nr:DUF3560 domain-containing protein [Alistipes sp.]
MSYESRKNRAERFRNLAYKAKDKSNAAYEQSNKAVSGIPMGQPILVGHHSEKRHRAALKRSHNAMDISVEEAGKADYYERKAHAAENNKAIYNDDPDAVNKLKEKLANLETLQEHMKAANKIFKNRKLSREEKIEKVAALKISRPEAESMLEGDSCGSIGYASFELANNNANIQTTRKRLEEVMSLGQREYKEYQINGYKVCEDPKDDRFRIFFGFKPDEEIRKQLKSSGYRWSPSNQAWQASLKPLYIDMGKAILESMPTKE